MYKTQKARGIDALKSMEGTWPYWCKIEHQFHVMPYNMPPYWERPVFARPCPVTPRHGFVESRRVNNLAELLDVFVQTRKAEPEGEVLIMRPLSGKASAVATEGGVTWGKGNDGATGGKGKQLHVPCPAGHWTKRIKGMSYTLAPDIKGEAYAEIVEDEGEPYVVQLRDGPKIGHILGNYVPHAGFVVTRTIQPVSADYDDLLGWEAKMKRAPRGTVVIGLSGLSSHLAVQAICHGHAVWLEKLPAGDALTPGDSLIGRTLNPSKAQPPELKRRDYLYMRNAGKKRVHMHKRSAVPLAIACLHAMPFWGRESHLLRLRITGAMTMLRLLTASCVGEARHFPNRGPGKSSRIKQVESKIDWSRLIAKEYKADYLERDTVYEAVLPKSLTTLVALLEGCVADFEAVGWARTEHCGDRHCRECGEMGEKKYSFGGPKWAEASRISLRLAKALLAFRAKPEKATWTEVVAAYNGGVLAAHNGGRALDKFCSYKWIDTVAKAPQFGFIGQMAMEVIAETKKPEKAAAPKVGVKLSPAQALGLAKLKAKAKAKISDGLTYGGSNTIETGPMKAKPTEEMLMKALEEFGGKWAKPPISPMDFPVFKSDPTA